MQLPNPAGRGGRKAGSWAGGWRQETGDAGEEGWMKEGNAGGLVCRESRGGFRDESKEQGRGLVEAGKDGPGSGLLRRQTLMIWSPGPAHTPVFLS